MTISASDLDLILSARIFVLQRAIGALIVTHPDPAAFARALDAATGLAQIEHLTAPGATPAVRDAATRLALELIGLAEDEASRRPRRTGDED